MSRNADSHVPHPGSKTEAPNGMGTAHPPRTGETLDRPVLDGSTEDYTGEFDDLERPRRAA
ncbi:hypothetical protein JD292_00135 [Leucobacter sp. CSA2]|uniref:Uncharacterized protein n=1 Tax=Leucobacter edaphi TaxID=2796472 RepID=A0A934Q958_9MICO|nr:hypothetical protein [Leucobacter edaphi]MBK0420495.1 hypothetical protein [Leucobacter edaphi]